MCFPSPKFSEPPAPAAAPAPPIPNASTVKKRRPTASTRKGPGGFSLRLPRQGGTSGLKL